jgi:hypothetical protein
MAAPTYFGLSQQISALVFYGLGALGLFGLLWEVRSEARLRTIKPERAPHQRSRRPAWAGIIVGAIILMACGALFWPSQDIAWAPDGADYGLEVEGSLESPDKPVRVYIGGLVFNGKNISGRTLYQIDASVTIGRTLQTFPLFIASGGQWVATNRVVSIPPGMKFTIGCQMRDDPVRCGDFLHTMKPDEFLNDVGRFVFHFSYNDRGHDDIFTLDRVEAYIKQRTEELDAQLRRMTSPSIKLRD